VQKLQTQLQFPSVPVRIAAGNIGIGQMILRQPRPPDNLRRLFTQDKCPFDYFRRSAAMRIVMAVASFDLRRLFVLGAVTILAGCNTLHGGFNNRLGSTFYRQGNYTMARDEYQRAIANDPWNADYVHNLATAMKRQGDIAGAEATYHRAIEIDPGHQPSYHGLALLLKEQGRTTEAADLLQGWVAQQPYSAEPYIEMAWLKRETGDLKGAEEMLQTALRVKPNDPIATAQLGQLYQDTNQPDRAVAMYRRSLFTRWNQPQVQSRIGQMQRQGANGYVGQPAYAQPYPHSAAPYGRPAAPVTNGPVTNGPVTGLVPYPTPVVTGPPLQAGSTIADGDPAHATGSQISADLPDGQPH
jgi:tetratricopeptide (TPR) repeat protein